jgi:membrane-associated protease RseP (regulator of RpoE activity)
MSFLGVAGVIAFVVALLFSVMVHEAGHFLTARRFDMKVTEFFLGFGKRIWSFTRGETEFGIKAIPAGGYCRIVGMSVNEEMEESDRGRAFYLASAPKRLIVLGAGSFLHFVLGFLILVLLLAGIGTTTISNKIGEVAPCIISNSTGAADAKCAPDAPPSPAKISGLMVGDRITAINGTSIEEWSAAVSKIRNSPNKEITLTIKRGASSLTIPITPGTRALDGKTIGVIGISNTLENRKLPILKAVTNSGSLTWDLLKSSATSLASLPTKIPALFRQTLFHEKRDATGLVGVVGVARVSAQTASDPKLANREKIATFLLIISSLNIFVGLFNLLPLLPLDGGHMAVAVIDGLRRARAKRKGRPAPSEIDVERLLPLTMVVFTILAALSLLLLAADIFNPINLYQ